MFIVWALTGQLRERHENTVPRLVSRLDYSTCLGHAQGGGDFSSWHRPNAISVLAGLAAIAVPPPDLLGLCRNLASEYFGAHKPQITNATQTIDVEDFRVLGRRSRHIRSRGQSRPRATCTMSRCAPKHTCRSSTRCLRTASQSSQSLTRAATSGGSFKPSFANDERRTLSVNCVAPAMGSVAGSAP
jgi:hypothetical protein